MYLEPLSSTGFRRLQAAAAVVVLMAGCQRPAEHPQGPKVAPPTPVGISTSGPLDREKIRSVGKGQAYDATPGASDEDVLDSGVVAIIEPQEGVFQLDTTQLAKGYVIGRFINKSDKGIKRLGLPPGGTTYWFVYQRDGKWVSAYIADSDSSGYDRPDVPMVIHYPSRPWLQSVAQWQLPGVIGDKPTRGLGALGVIGLAEGSQPWISCVTIGCCKGQ